MLNSLEISAFRSGTVFFCELKNTSQLRSESTPESGSSMLNHSLYSVENGGSAIWKTKSRLKKKDSF